MIALKKRTFLISSCVLLVLGLTSFAARKDSNQRANTEENFPKTTFKTFFPDTNLALLVAERLNKQMTDKVTIHQLASIKGVFQVGPGDVANLTGIGYLTGINEFSCFKNEVTVLPAEIGKLTNLVSLDLCKAYSLRKIPPQIGNLKKLKKIRLSLTEIALIPKEIGELSELENLWIGCNRLTSIPKEIGNLKKLKNLDIHLNSMTQLPDEICDLVSLTTLDARYCKLTRLPQKIGQLKKLKEMDLFHNDLKSLPKSIQQLDHLEVLNVYDNFKLTEHYKKYLPKRLKSKK